LSIWIVLDGEVINPEFEKPEAEGFLEPKLLAPSFGGLFYYVSGLEVDLLTALFWYEFILLSKGLIKRDWFPCLEFEFWLFICLLGFSSAVPPSPMLFLLSSMSLVLKTVSTNSLNSDFTLYFSF
jgi:hypothetical protein